MFLSTPTRKTFAFLFVIVLNITSLDSQPRSSRMDVTVRELGTVGRSSVRIRRDPASSNLYILQNDGVIRRVNLSGGGTASFTTVYQKSDHGLNAPLGMAFGKDGTMFLVGNDSTGRLGTATIVRGVPNPPGSENRTWSVLAKTVVYQYGNVYNHRMSGIIVDPNGEYVYVNSGAATDHGELRDGKRESGLTSIILKLPTNGQDITLQDDREWLRTNGYLMAEGIRNEFDYAYAGNGDLFGVENSGDRDDPEELNCIREGRHYGFPWRIGENNTPQQFTPYNPRTDSLLSPQAWGGGNLYQTFSNDSTYPPPPSGVVFTEPVPSSGPDADRFRDTTKGNLGKIRDASSLGLWIPTFAPHRSPNGIVFDKDSVLANGLTGGAFVISLSDGALLRALGDTSQDLLHVALTQIGEGYSARVTRLVSGFREPLGIELVGDKLYVLETDLWSGPNPSPKLWEISLPMRTTSVRHEADGPEVFKLRQNYPNPFNPTTVIKFSLPDVGTSRRVGIVSLKVYDVLGREIAALIDNEMKGSGVHSVHSDAANLPSGVYLYRLFTPKFVETKKMLLLR